jgi:hypothetical protein
MRLIFASLLGLLLSVSTAAEAKDGIATILNVTTEQQRQGNPDELNPSQSRDAINQQRQSQGQNSARPSLQVPRSARLSNQTPPLSCNGRPCTTQSVTSAPPK